VTSRSLIHVIAIALALSIPFNVQASDEDVKGMFVVVTSPDPQTQLMAMVLSTQVVKKGKYVRVLLCGAGGDLALRNGKEVILKPKHKSPQMLLRNLIKKGVTVQVCPLYLPNKGASPADLIEGVTQAKPPLVAEALLEEEVKLFTF
jgi:predicted peroxiredoxin